MCDAASSTPASASPSAPGVHSPGAGKGQAAVFCTALLDSDVGRYQGWVDYYTAFFAGLEVDLYLFNDGPARASLDWKGARLVTFECALGRQDTWVFPGWKRSFSAAVGQLSADYRFVGHIESDTVILQTGRAEFLNALHRPGYCTGYTAQHRFADTSLQILNSQTARDFLIRRYATVADFHRNERFEKVVQYALRPRLILHGERMEGCDPDPHQRYTYLAQMPLPRFHSLYPNGEPKEMVGPLTLWRRRAAHEALRLKWNLRHRVNSAFGSEKYR